MSRRRTPRDLDTRPQTVCDQCAAPVANGYRLCANDTDLVYRDLVEWADWLAEALDDTIAGIRGIRYSGSGSGSDSDVRVNYAASTLQRDIARLFAYAAQALGTDHPARLDQAADTLANHTDQLARLDGIAAFAHQLCTHTIRARNLIDTPAERQYLGRCQCGLMLYGHTDDTTARCDCGRTTDTATRRHELITALEARTITAADAAKLLAHLGIADNRERLRKRINQWNRRGNLIACHTDTGDTFRLGDIMQRLAPPTTTPPAP